MTLPSSGAISIGDVLEELGKTLPYNASLKDCADGTVAILNTSNNLSVIQAAPYRLSDWYDYDHNLGANVPTLFTAEPSNITSSSANSGGVTLNDHGFTITTKGLVWKIGGVPSKSGYTGIYTHSVGGTGVFIGTYVTGLTSGTEYNVRAWATNSEGDGYGQNWIFSTTTAYPTVVTNVATSITTDTAILQGDVIDEGTGGLTSPYRVFKFAKNSDSYGSDLVVGFGGTGEFHLDVSGLDSNTLYKFKAGAHNATGYAYGIERTFTTLSVSYPIVRTDAATGIGTSTATLNGEILDAGSTPISVAIFRITKDGDIWVNGDEYSITTSLGVKSYNVTGLDLNTTYKFSISATNNTGPSYGDTLTFTTANV